MLRRAPRFHAHMPLDNTNFEEGCYYFSELLKEIEPLSSYTRDFQFLTAMEQVESGIGLNPITDMEQIIEFLLQRKELEPELAEFYGIWGEKFRDGMQSAYIDYHWAKGTPHNNLFTFRTGRPDERDGVGLPLFLRIAEKIIMWKRPQYMWCGDYSFFSKKKGIFQLDRVPANWFCWVPQQVEPSQIPSAAIVRPMLEGTLIVSLEQYFNIDNLEAVQRVNDVEVEMNEAGILPHHTELDGG